MYDILRQSYDQNKLLLGPRIPLQLALDKNHLHIFFTIACWVCFNANPKFVEWSHFFIPLNKEENFNSYFDDVL